MNQRIAHILSYALFGALAVWGIYTLLYYVGAPLHAGVLLTDEAQKSIAAACPGNGLFCQGLYGLVPFVLHTLGRARPFLVYGIVSLLVYGVFVGWQFMKSGGGRLRLRLRPWHFGAFFLASLWVIFLVLSHGSNGDLPARRLIQPGPEVYKDINPQTLQSLTRNFEDLRDAGCLTEVGETDTGIRLFDLSELCVQSSFITRVLFQVGVAAIFLLELLVLGHTILTLAGFRPRRLFLEGMIGIGVGIMAWIAVLWTVALAGVFIAPVGWAMVLLVPVLCYRSVLYWGRVFLRHEWTVELRWHSVQIFLLWLVISYLALNFLSVIRPFPIGWDDLGSYLNRPRLLVSYGSSIPSMATFQWEYLTALGFLLFGFGSYVGATASMIINWTEGLLALLGVILLTREFLGRGRGLIAAMLFYALPLIGHFSFADMKIDNAVFLMGTLATLGVFLFLFPVADEEEQAHAPDRRWLMLAGLFIAFAFSMKVTAVMVLFGLITVLAGGLFGWAACLGMGILIFVFLALQQTLNVAGIAHRIFGDETILTKNLFLAIGAPLALLPLGWAMLRGRGKIRAAALSVGLFAGCVLLGTAPWLLYNNYQAGKVIPGLEMGLPNRYSPRFVLEGDKGDSDPQQDTRILPPELQLNRDDPACKSTGTREELDRYWGFGTGLSHYFTLPWRTVMNLDSGGYYVTTAPALLLFPLLLLLPYFWSRKGRWLRYVFASTIVILIEWMFLANGIPWYGAGVFLGLVIGLEALVARAPDDFSRAAAGTLVGLSLLTSFGFRFWQFEQQRNLIEYPMGKISAASLEQRTIPWYNPIKDVVVDRHTSVPGRPYMYRVGTFIPYFIPKNLEMIGIADHQLDFFNCLNQERDHAKTLARLKALGFNSIIFDTNTATIERDEQGSLHQKVQRFIDFLNDTALGLQVLVNDPAGGVAFILIP